jgi:hypothetical protein
MASRSENPALAQALRLAKDKDKGPVPRGYEPPVRPLPGKRAEILDGQLDLDGNEHQRVFAVDGRGVDSRVIQDGSEHGREH